MCRKENRDQVRISLSLLLRKREETVLFSPSTHSPAHNIEQCSYRESVWSSVHLPPGCDFLVCKLGPEQNEGMWTGPASPLCLRSLGYGGRNIENLIPPALQGESATGVQIQCSGWLTES